MPLTLNSSPYSHSSDYYNVDSSSSTSRAHYSCDHEGPVSNSRSSHAFAGQEYSLFSDHRENQPHPELSVGITHLSDQVTSLSKQIHQLQRNNRCLLEKLDNLQMEFLSEIRALGTAAIPKPSPSTQDTLSFSLGSFPVPAVNVDDFPNIKFWTKKQYTTAKNQKKSSTGLIPPKINGNTMTWYVETEDGEPVDCDTVEAIRMHARTTWQSLVDKNMAPCTWADANLEAHNFYEHHMCRRFPELSYGAHNWKAHMIATENYPSWYSKHVGRGVKVKTELASHLKRSPSPSPLKLECEFKKAKLITSNTGKKPQDQHGGTNDNVGAVEQSGAVAFKVLNPLAEVFSDPAIASTLVVPCSTTSTVPQPQVSSPSADPSASSSSSPVTSNTPASATIPTISVPIASSKPSYSSSPPIVSNTPAPATIPAISITPTPSIMPLPISPANPSEAAPDKKQKKAKAGNANNPKSICKRAWISANPHGTEDGFAAYWVDLVASGGHQTYVNQAAKAKK